MPYVINDACIGSKDQACVDVCPVDCIYEGLLKFWIHPTECIDCGACEADCPVSAIYYVDAKNPTDDLKDAHKFFETTLPGRDSPLGSPGGAAKVGPVGAELPRVTASTTSSGE